MKSQKITKIISTIALIGSIANGYSQNLFPALGNTGLGTTSPQTTLHLKKFDCNNYDPLTIRFDHNYGMNFGPIPNSIREIWDLRVNAQQNYNGEHGFEIVSRFKLLQEVNCTEIEDNPIEKVCLHINPGGNVGIGNRIPVAKLDIEGNLRVASLLGNGTRMMVTDANGLVSAQVLPTQTYQTLSFNSINRELAISNGNDVIIPAQTLSIAGDVLSISGGNNITIPNDNLGNHKATTSLDMQINKIINIGDLRFNDNTIQSTSSLWENVLSAPSTTAARNIKGIAFINFPLATFASNHALFVNGSGSSTGGFSTSSDYRFKKNITTLENSLSNILKIRGVQYYFDTDKFKDRNFPKENTIGFIAQELKEILPQAVMLEEDGYYSVNYDQVIPVLVEAIKELNNEIDKLKNERSGNINNSISFDSKIENKIILNQNSPNPFSQNTEIYFSIPKEIFNNNWKLIFTDLNGKIVHEKNISESESKIFVSKENLGYSGIFIYSLTNQKDIILSKKMIVE